VTEITDFGLIVLVVAGGFALAVLASRLAVHYPVPEPAIFLLAATGAATLFPRLQHDLSIRTVERIGVVALIAILFDGGMAIGRRRFRVAAQPIAVLGVLGTFGTAGVIAVAAHTFFDFDWTIAGVLGAALAPTDPAVMFSVLGGKEIGGRTGTILEGESGANDPVGIALMIGMLDFATHAHASFWNIVREFCVEMAIGLALGVVGGLVLARLLRSQMPKAGLYPLRTLASAAVLYGVTTVAHGSGFLAVFVAGVLVADRRLPHFEQIESFHGSLAQLAEIVMFTALGLTISFGELGRGDLWADGLALAAILAFVARPLAVAPLLARARLRRGEKLFVCWGGLRGAVPILLAALAVLSQVRDAHRVYGIVYVVVAFSVVVQGTSIPWAARRLGVPMRRVERP
jgi:cell volume regulation protein A